MSAHLWGGYPRCQCLMRSKDISRYRGRRLLMCREKCPSIQGGREALALKQFPLSPRTPGKPAHHQPPLQAPKGKGGGNKYVVELEKLKTKDPQPGFLQVVPTD